MVKVENGMYAAQITAAGPSIKIGDSVPVMVPQENADDKMMTGVIQSIVFRMEDGCLTWAAEAAVEIDGQMELLAITADDILP